MMMTLHEVMVAARTSGSKLFVWVNCFDGDGAYFEIAKTEFFRAMYRDGPKPSDTMINATIRDDGNIYIN